VLNVYFAYDVYSCMTSKKSCTFSIRDSFRDSEFFLYHAFRCMYATANRTNAFS